MVMNTGFIQPTVLADGETRINGKNLTAHKVIWCGHTGLDKSEIEVHDADDGTQYVQDAGYRIKVRWCSWCKNIDLEHDAWTRLAACKGQDELFFSGTWHGVREAKKICEGCKVQVNCLEWALRNHEDEGVWGGTTRSERLKIRTAHNKARVAAVG